MQLDCKSSNCCQILRATTKLDVYRYFSGKFSIPYKLNRALYRSFKDREHSRFHANTPGRFTVKEWNVRTLVNPAVASHRLMQLKRLQVRPVLDPSSINAIQTSGSGCFHRLVDPWIIGGHDNTEKFLATPREILERRRNSKLLPALTRGSRATAGASKYLQSRVAPPDCIDISTTGSYHPHFNYGNCRLGLCPISGLKLIQFKRLS